MTGSEKQEGWDARKAYAALVDSVEGQLKPFAGSYSREGLLTGAGVELLRGRLNAAERGIQEAERDYGELFSVVERTEMQSFKQRICDERGRLMTLEVSGSRSR